MQTQKVSFLSIIVLMSLVGAIPAHSSPAMPSQAKASPTASVPATIAVAATSAPLLSSPLLSPAAKMRLKQELVQETQAYALVKSGDEAAKAGDWTIAEQSYQEALEVSPAYGLGYQLSLYGLIACCHATGDTTQGLAYSRQAIYRHGSAVEGFHENDTEKLMQFALLLNKTGQSVEAISVYNRAASLLDYRDSQYNGGNPYLKVLLPELAEEPTVSEPVRYTPERLQALAKTALAHEEIANNNKEAQAYMRDAVKLYPDSAVTYYYLGEALPSRTPEQIAAYQKAVGLGDDATVAAAKERLKVLR
ncbi:MAG: hypothetical protein ACRYFS_05350 [Janthinobacterium lividum]